MLEESGIIINFLGQKINDILTRISLKNEKFFSHVKSLFHCIHVLGHILSQF